MVRGTEVSHHWGYGEIYGGEQHPYDNDDEEERRKKKKKKNSFKRLIEWIAKGAEGEEK